MAAPNLKQPLTITGKTLLYEATTSLSSVLANSVASSKLLKVNVIRAANILTTGVNVDATVYRGAVHYYLIEAANVSPTTSLVISDRNEYVYLEEGDSLYLKASAASGIHFTIHYEEIS